MGLLKWVKKHPWEAAAIGAGIALTGGAAAGVGPAAGLFGGEAAAGAAGVGGAGSLIGGGVGAAESLPFMAAMGEALPVSEFASSLMPGAASSFEAFAPEVASAAFPGYTGGGVYAGGAGAAGGLPFELNPKNAMMLASMMGAGGGGQQRQLGSPPDLGNPMQRPAIVSQEDIMKHWLQINDPRTYARLYGQPQGVV